MQTKHFTATITPKGSVYRRAYSGEKLKHLLEKKLSISLEAARDKNGIINFEVLCSLAFTAGISKNDFSKILDKSAKKQFADNFIWRFLKKNFNLDIAIPFVTGYYTKGALKGNLVVNAGHAGYAGQIGGVTSAPFTAMAYGTGTNSAAAADTALQTETARGAATISRTTTSVTNDTCQWVKSFTAAGVVAITEEGLFDNNSSGGNMLAHQVFSAINLILNDVVQFTHTIQS